MLADAEPRELSGSLISKIAFQRGAEGAVSLNRTRLSAITLPFASDAWR
jgi:hypothetical protein